MALYTDVLAKVCFVVFMRADSHSCHTVPAPFVTKCIPRAYISKTNTNVYARMCVSNVVVRFSKVLRRRCQSKEKAFAEASGRKEENEDNWTRQYTSGCFLCGPL